MTRALFLTLALAGLAHGFEEKQQIREAYSGVKKLMLENVNGRIDVAGYDGAQVLFEATRTGKADTAEELAEARREVRLNTTWPETGVLRIKVEYHPSDRTHRRRNYSVRYDMTVKVPRDLDAVVKTVNGSASLSDTNGAFEVKSVNGAVEAVGMGGQGSAGTVNGAVKVVFTRNPSGPCSFKTVNGAVDVTFRSGLGANVKARTHNGAVYTGFPATALDTGAEQGERRDGRWVYRKDRTQQFRIASGGPEIALETVNGSIQIREGK